MRSIIPILLAAGAACAVPSWGETAHLQFDRERTKVLYQVNTALHTVHGSFSLKSGSIDYDTATGKASGEIVIDAASGDSGSPSRDGRMNKVVLETAKFAEIRFSPDHVEGRVAETGESEVKLHGMFLLHGATRELTLTAKVRRDAQGILRTNADFEVPYVAWGLKNPGNFVLKVADKVQVHIEADARLKGQ